MRAETMGRLQIDFDEYCKLERMNASTLVHGCKSMRSLRLAMNGNAKAPSNAMQFGNKYHTMILEPEEFERSFCVMPNFAASDQNKTAAGSKSDSWGTTFAKESKRQFIADAERDGQEVITRDEYDRGLAMCESIAADPFATELIKASDKEVTLLGEIDDVPFKCRLDLMSASIADIKGCRDAGIVPFGNDAARLRYAFKTSIYREIFKQHEGYLPDVFLIAVESAGEFDCCVHRVPDAALDHAFSQVRKILARFKDCLESGVWPGANGGEPFVEMYVPNWAMPQDDDLDWSGIDE